MEAIHSTAACQIANSSLVKGLCVPAQHNFLGFPWKIYHQENTQKKVKGSEIPRKGNART